MTTLAMRKILAVVMTMTIVISTAQINQVKCSSYLDDYFLPTAKIALNKLQQSLSPNSYNQHQPAVAPLPNVSQQQQQQQPQESTTTSSNTAAATINYNIDQQESAIKTIQPNDKQTANDNGNPSNSNEATSIADQVNSSNSGSTLSSKPENVEAKNFGFGSDLMKPPPSASVQQQPSPQDIAQDPYPVAKVVESRESDKISLTDITGSPSQALPPQEPTSTSTMQTSTDLATDTDPTASSQQEQVATETSESEPKLPVVDTVDQLSIDKASTTTRATTTTTQPETPPATAQVAQEQQQQQQSTEKQQPVIVIESKSADEAAIKETELEAVAAVEASIGFGDLFGSMGDSCYDEYANARYCEPEFENLAFERQVEVSSECGSPPSRFCTTYLNERHEQIRNCHICDAQHPKKRHPAAYLTDLNNSNQPTCWVSAPIQATSSALQNYNTTSGISISGSSSGNSMESSSWHNTKPDNVTLTLNLDKKYEIVYISMQFCSMKPDSLAIYKSMDYGEHWIPYQFYSSQCRRMYGRQSRAVTGRQLNEFEATCANSSQSQTTSSSSSLGQSGRIAFSTLDGGSQLNRSSQQLQDWITATNIRIVLDRHQASWIHSSNLIHPHAHNHHHLSQNNQNHQPPALEAGGGGSGSGLQQQQQQQPGATAAVAGQLQQQTNSNAPESATESSLTSPSDTFNYAMSDLTVGGRCKCNGHASRCIHSKEGRLQCDCRHNTAGRDCEKCAPFHFDRPWARATQLDANPCQPCNCNGHSRKCRFDAELYRLSGKRSGGVCIGCRDNTAGRFCNYCKEGFTRDHSKPMSDKEACKHCDCHPIGSQGRACNQTTGQCPCKEGVSGLQCNRCAPGYQQSSSLTDPCIKLPENENDINYYPPLTVNGDVDISPTSEQQPQEDASPAEVPSLEDIVPPTGAGLPRPKINNNNNNKLNPMDDLANGGNVDPMDPQLDLPTMHNSHNTDKDNDEMGDLGDVDPPGFGGVLRKPYRSQAPLWHQQHNSRSSSSNKANTYYGYHHSASSPTQRHPISSSNRHHQFESHPSRMDVDDDEQQDQEEDLENLPASRPRIARPMAGQADDEYGSPSHPLANGRGYYYTPTNAVFTSKPRYINEYRGNQRRLHANNGQNQPRHRNSETDMLMQPAMASVEHGPDGLELNSLDYGLMPPPSPPLPPSSLYGNSAADMDNFNQIQTSPNLRRIAASRRRQGSLAGGRQRVGSGTGSQFNSDQQQQQQPPPMLMMGSNEVVCGDCQSGTKRLNLRQFCHLHFAIKATILNKYMADDWTRFEVEIQDIFKSSQGGGGGVTTISSASSEQPSIMARPASMGNINNNNINNNMLMQADEPQSNVANNGSTVALETQIDNTQNVPTTHRIKVGTIQSIWVPTEDLTCRCPRLKLQSTYLLMGSIDAKENSANALQLDRHGVALEWKSSLQEKLMRYQRRLSRGKC